ncbi:MAG: hypothetical protein ACRDTC_08705 [Pseudonocardiaceae bacterium]
MAPDEGKVDKSTPRDGDESRADGWTPLQGGDLTVWVVLRRVNEGGMALLDGAFYHHSRVVPCYLNTPLVELVEAGRLRLANSDGTGMQEVIFTGRGHESYEVLCGKRGVSSDSTVSTCPDMAGQVHGGMVEASAP